MKYDVAYDILVTKNIPDAHVLMEAGNGSLPMVAALEMGASVVKVFKMDDYHPPELLRLVNRDLGEKVDSVGRHGYSVYELCFTPELFIALVDMMPDVNYTYIVS